MRKLPIRFGNRAIAEYYNAILWYESERTGLGTEFEAEVQALLALVSKQPDRFPLTVRGIREAPVDRFPYCVCYRVRPDRVFVVGLFHQSRDPQEWQSR
jgi:plasmid stabilization system protein ParE